MRLALPQADFSAPPAPQARRLCQSEHIHTCTCVHRSSPYSLSASPLLTHAPTRCDVWADVSAAANRSWGALAGSDCHSLSLPSVHWSSRCRSQPSQHSTAASCSSSCRLSSRALWPSERHSPRGWVCQASYDGCCRWAVCPLRCTAWMRALQLERWCSC